MSNEVIKAQVQEEIASITEVPILSSWQDAGVCRFVFHIDWSVKRGFERVVVVSNDTDSIVLILRYMTTLINMGLQKVRVEFGTGVHKRTIPLHRLQVRFRAAFCSILMKVHVIPGNEAVSKVGTKHAELTCNPFSLTNFAETDSLTTVDISVVERYIGQVWTGARSNTTADTFEKC